MLRLVTLAMLAGAVAGCASFAPTTPLKEDKASFRFKPYKSDDGAFVFHAKLPPDEEFQKRHFGYVLTRYDILPVEVALENTSDDWAFEIATSRTVVQLGDGTQFDVVPAKEVVNVAGFSYSRAFFWGLLLIFPGVIEAFNVSDANRAMTVDYENKVLGDLSLPPKGAKQGFVFLRPREKDLDDLNLREGTMRLDVVRRASRGQASGDPLPNVLFIFQ